MLSSEKKKQYKACVERRENGFGIKIVSTSTGVENVIAITSDSTRQCGKRNSKDQDLKQILSTESTDTLARNSAAISKILSQLEPKVKELKPEIVGFHIFDRNTSLAESIDPLTSLIFVANRKLAREKGVCFNIPGRLANVQYVGTVNRKHTAIKFKAQAVVKPFTIIVGDFVLYINICCDAPPRNRNRATSTQTRKENVSDCLVRNVSSLFYTEPVFGTPLQTEHKEIQTDTKTCLEKATQTKFESSNQDCTVQTNAVMVHDNQTSTSLLGSECWNENTNSSKNQNTFLDEEISQTSQSLDFNESKISLIGQDSSGALKTFDSHVYSNQSIGYLMNHTHQIHPLNNFEFTDDCQTSASSIKTTRQQQEAVTLFDNISNCTRTSSNFEFVESKYTKGIDSNCPLKNSPTNSEHYENNKGGSMYSTCSNPKSNSRSKSSTSLTEIKQHLNEASCSLRQLYSLVELIEHFSINSEFSDGTLKIGTKSIYSATSSNNSERTVENSSSIDSLCDRCGLFYSGAKCKGHDECDEHHCNEREICNINNILNYSNFNEHDKFRNSTTDTTLEECKQTTERKCGSIDNFFELKSQKNILHGDVNSSNESCKNKCSSVQGACYTICKGSNEKLVSNSQRCDKISKTKIGFSSEDSIKAIKLEGEHNQNLNKSQSICNLKNAKSFCDMRHLDTLEKAEASNTSCRISHTYSEKSQMLLFSVGKHVKSWIGSNFHSKISVLYSKCNISSNSSAMNSDLLTSKSMILDNTHFKPKKFPRTMTNDVIRLFNNQSQFVSGEETSTSTLNDLPSTYELHEGHEKSSSNQLGLQNATRTSNFKNTILKDTYLEKDVDTLVGSGDLIKTIVSLSLSENIESEISKCKPSSNASKDKSFVSNANTNEVNKLKRNTDTNQNTQRSKGKTKKRWLCFAF